MVKKRGLLLLVFSLAMGVGAAWVANNWVKMRVMPTADAAQGTAGVVVAALKIPYGTKVEAHHLRTISMPADSMPAGSSSDPAELEGRVATQTVLAGEILIRERFAEHAGGSTLSALVAPQMRAVTVRVDDVVGVAGFLLPGNLVDVVAARKVRETAVADTILQGVKVLAVDQTTSTDKNEPIIVRAVTLEVSPRQAEELAKARQEGKIQLTLRNPQDLLIHEPEIEEPAPAVVAVAPPPRARVSEVTIVRGTSVSKTRTRP